MGIIPHPERVVFPGAGITRQQMVDYYRQMGPLMLPYYRNRALTLIRWPHGLGGSHFYQKHPDSNAAGDSPITVDSVEQLAWWAARGAIEWHVPLGTLSSPAQHDWAVMDMDPPGDDWMQVVGAARIMGHLLDVLSIPCAMKTSGRRGLHFFIRIEPEDAGRVILGLKAVAQVAVKTYPEVFTVERLKAKRQGKIYLDYLQNGAGRTMIGIYSVRALETASVSCPVRWTDLIFPPDYWTMSRVLLKVKEQGDWFAQLPAVPLTARLGERGLGPGPMRAGGQIP